MFANINAAAVTELAADLAAVLKPGGRLVAGGIIEERLEAPRAALKAAGLEIDRVIAEGDWRTILATR